MKDNIIPVFRERSRFYKKFSKYTIPEMLVLHGFLVNEIPLDYEDIVHIEKKREFLANKGIIDVPIYFKQEFSAEYALENTSVIVEGYYLRMNTGEKRYSTYAYYFYRTGYDFYKGTSKQINYAEGVNKLQFLEEFERKLHLLGVGGEYNEL